MFVLSRTTEYFLKLSVYRYGTVFLAQDTLAYGIFVDHLLLFFFVWLAVTVKMAADENVCFGVGFWKDVARVWAVETFSLLQKRFSNCGSSEEKINQKSQRHVGILPSAILLQTSWKEFQTLWVASRSAPQCKLGCELLNATALLSNYNIRSIKCCVCYLSLHSTNYQQLSPAVFRLLSWGNRMSCSTVVMSCSLQ